MLSNFSPSYFALNTSSRLDNVLIRYDALDKHYYRLKDENERLTSVVRKFMLGPVLLKSSSLLL